MKHLSKYLVLVVLLFGICLAAYAMSPNDAIDFATKTNNYLISGESALVATPQVTITYLKEDYWAVTVYKDSAPSVYLPINNSKTSLATGDIELRKLIETSIVLSRTYAQRNALPVGDWPFSHTTKNDFYDLERVLGAEVAETINVRTELSKLTGTAAKNLELLADSTQAEIEALAAESRTVADTVEEARLYEEKYFSTPDTNMTTKYEKYFSDYFQMIDEYVTHYNEITQNISTLTQGIATLDIEGLTANQKDFMVKSLALPTQTGKIPSFSSKTQQIRTLVEAIFSASKSTESFVSNLNTRVLMNTAWKQMYGPNDKLLSINTSFNSLSSAAEAILGTENIDLWADQDSVEALKLNWTQAKSKYSGGEYEKASSFATKAQKNSEDILREGTTVQTNDVPQELLIQIAVVLVVAIIGLFLFEKFYWSKRNKDEDEKNDEEYYSK